MATAANPFTSVEYLSASGKDAAKLSLPSLQSKMKCDPEGYTSELLLLYRHFDSSLHLHRHHSALSPSSDPSLSKDLADLVTFLAHVTPFYPIHLSDFPNKLCGLLREEARMLPASLRGHLVQSLVLLINRKMIGMEETLDLFMDLQTLGDKTLRKLCFTHIVHSIRRMNQKHKDETKNRKLQSILFSLLQQEEETRAKRAFITLCDLHRRKVWFDDRTANAICTACFHTSSRIMIAALSFLLGYDGAEEDYDSDDSSSEDDTTIQKPLAVLSREDVYKANHKGTKSSKKKKKAKLERVMRKMKKQQRNSAENTSSSSYSPLVHLKDAQGFAEKLFSRLQKSNEKFEVKMMMLKVISRTVGLHRLVLLNFYPFLQKYVQPHQRDVTNLLAAAVQACHDMVPPDAVEPLFRQIVNQFVHDRSRTEAIAVGLNVVREICLRIPLLMTEDLLQDLVLYKKSHEKAVSTAARSLITLFREICPSFLVKKDRGRPINPNARPKAFGETHVVSNVPGIELLRSENGFSSDTSDYEHAASNIGEGNEEAVGNLDETFSTAASDDEDEIAEPEDHDDDVDSMNSDEVADSDDNDDIENDSDPDMGGDSDDDNADVDNSDHSSSDSEDIGGQNLDADDMGGKLNDRKRKFADFDSSLRSTNSSLRALKRLAGLKKSHPFVDSDDSILSNKDYQQIKELQAKKEVNLALSQQGLLKKSSDSRSAIFKIPSSEQLSSKCVDPAKLEVHIRRKLTKEERLELVKAGREDRGKYCSRIAVKQKKTGGLSNRQKEHKKAMPLAAKKAKVARSRKSKSRQQAGSGKQFKGRKAWKYSH